jgi:Tfp pilus assembly protein PilF
VLIAWSNSLGSGFHFDDSVIFTNPWILSSGFGLDIFRLDQTRPLTYLTFHWNYLLDGEHPFLYHLVNLLLHAANSILMLKLARKFVSPFTAGCVAVLFALHPLQTESVTYVFARSTLLSTHFALWTLWFYLGGKYLESALIFGVSLLAKEETIALPGFLLLLELFQQRPASSRRIGYFALLAGFAALAAGRLFYLIHISPADPGVGRVRGITTGSYLLTQSRVIWIYLRLLVAPVGLNLDRDVRLSTGLFSPWTTLPAIVALLTLIAALAWFAWRKRSAAALWGLGYFVLILPGSSIVAQADLMFEHRTYLPTVGVLVALGFVLERIPRPKLTITFAVLVPVMLAGTILRNADWYDEKTFWADAAEKSPRKGRVWLGLAHAWAGDSGKAREFLDKGLAVDPDNADLHTEYGILLLRTNRPAEALAHFQRAMALTEQTADRWNNIGGAWFQLHNPDAALDSFQRALKLDPCNFNAHRNLMMYYSARNDRHAVWQAAEVPPTCSMIPDQARELEMLRHRAGQP